MPHISMESAIMAPILIVQVILIPVAASWMMASWVDQRRETALQDVASHMGSTIQQLYFALNHEGISAGTTIQTANVPPFIESIPYVVTASDRKVENSTIIDIYLTLVRVGVSTSASVTLGPNASWQESTFVSNSTQARIEVQKLANDTLIFTFG